MYGTGASFLKKLLDMIKNYYISGEGGGVLHRKRDCYYNLWTFDEIVCKL